MGSEERFYGVLVPNEHRDEESVDVFTDRREAERRAAQFKGIARFKVFPNYEQALVYSRSPYEGRDVRTKGVEEEKASPFKTPSPQDMAELRTVVESGDTVRFSAMVRSNPRYLVTNSDIPTVVRVACWWNVLHVAAMFNRAQMCQLILDTVDDRTFVGMLHEDGECRENLQALSALYLNTPEAKMFDTPLHMATKCGFVEVVRVLASHPRCDKTVRNAEGHTPRQAIGQRCKDLSPQLREELEKALDERCYVPVLRAEDDSQPAKVGEPWSPTRSIASMSPTSPKHVTRAIAGPMTPQQAAEFHARLKTPRGKGELRNILRSDSSKGLERIGRELASEMQVPWKEQWDFLGSFCDVRDANGLASLEDHLRRNYLKMVENQRVDVRELSRTATTISELSRAFANLNFDSMATSDSDLADDFESRRRSSKKEPMGRVEEEGPCTCWTSRIWDIEPTAKRACHRVAERLVRELEDCANLFPIVDENEIATGAWQELLQRTREVLSYLVGLEIPNAHKATSLCVGNLLKKKGDGEVLRFIASLVSYRAEYKESSSEEEQEVEDACVRRGLWRNKASRKKRAAERRTMGQHLLCVLTAREESHLCDCFQQVPILPLDLSSDSHLAHEDFTNGEILDEYVRDCDYYDAVSSCSDSSESSETSSEEMVTPEEGVAAFLNGDQPTRADVDVFRALKGVDIDPVLYPHTYLWHVSMLRYFGAPILNGQTVIRTTPLKSPMPKTSTPNTNCKRSLASSYEDS